MLSGMQPMCKTQRFVDAEGIRSQRRRCHVRAHRGRGLTHYDALPGWAACFHIELKRTSRKQYRARSEQRTRHGCASTYTQKKALLVMLSRKNIFQPSCGTQSKKWQCNNKKKNRLTRATGKLPPRDALIMCEKKVENCA